MRRRVSVYWQTFKWIFVWMNLGLWGVWAGAPATGLDPTVDYEHAVRQLSGVSAPATLSDWQSALAYFDIPDTAVPWRANSFIPIGALRESGGVFYQAFSSGMTGTTPLFALPQLGDPASGLKMAFDHELKWAYFADAKYAGAFRYGASNGIVWYFALNALYLLAEEDLPRVRRLLNSAIHHLVSPRLSNETLLRGAKRILNGCVYEAQNNGTTQDGALTAMSSATLQDGSVIWKFVFDNPGYADPWLADSVVQADTLRVSQGDLWIARGSGKTGKAAPVRQAMVTRTGRFNDGAIDWQWVAPQAKNQGWQWYLYDTFEDMVRYRPPDSTDSYAGELLALAMRYTELAGNDEWLAELSSHGKPTGGRYTNLDVLKQVADANIRSQIRNYQAWEPRTAVRYAEQRVSAGNLYRSIQGGISGEVFNAGQDYAAVYVDGTAQWRLVGPVYNGLINTFQFNLTAKNTYYDESFLADACETWRGLNKFANYLEKIKDNEAGSYRRAADGLNQAIATMYRPAYQRWAWSQTSRLPQDWSSAWYPSAFANVQPQLYQVPLPADHPGYQKGWRFFEKSIPFWWLRNFSAFPTLMPAYIAVRDAKDFDKGRRALEKSRRYYIGAGAVPSGRFFIQEVAYALAIEKMLTAANAWQTTDRGVFNLPPPSDAWFQENYRH